MAVQLLLQHRTCTLAISPAKPQKAGGTKRPMPASAGRWIPTASCSRGFTVTSNWSIQDNQVSLCPHPSARLHHQHRPPPHRLNQQPSAPSSGAASERFQKKAGSARCHGWRAAAAGSAAAASYLGARRQRVEAGWGKIPCPMQAGSPETATRQQCFQRLRPQLSPAVGWHQHACALCTPCLLRCCWVEEAQPTPIATHRCWLSVQSPP